MSGCADDDDDDDDDVYIYHTMRYLFGIYKELIKCGLQRNSDTNVVYRSIYGRAQNWTSRGYRCIRLNKAYLTSWISCFTS